MPAEGVVTVSLRVLAQRFFVKTIALAASEA